MEEGAPPSDYAIEALVRGRPGGLSRTAVLTAWRSLLIAPGLYVAGVRGKCLAWGSVAASVSITLGMIAIRAARKRAGERRLPERADD
jgi:hypothetical protein